ncbi:MAG: hypothetical protein U1C73_14740 [Dietzia sp.]|nr:hypothetical protein [Dietzia sp.]
MSTKIRHTKSTSGRTHRLTVATAAQRPVVRMVTLTYREAPQFDDQVQGDLIRKYWADGGTVSPIGTIPDSPRIDPELDAIEAERGRPTPRAIAEACYKALGSPDSITPDQFIGAIMTAVRVEREK